MKIFFGRNSLILVFLQIALVLLTRGVAGEEGNATCPVTQYQCANGNCIPISWACDHDNDCGDNSEEANCSSTTCSEDEFSCNNGKCVPMRWTCDEDKDCSDGSDELESMCSSRTCGPNQFHCNSGVCISDKWKCDGSSDCRETDGEDEENCPATCQDDMFTCNDGQCITKTWRCDFDFDCNDESDEKNCPKPPTSCKSEEFQCGDGACIKSDWFCDGDIDCNDKSDENGCNGTTSHCSVNQFQCKSSGECIHNSWFCDQDADCEDESDENCNVTCRSDQFQCTDDKDCLSLSVRCNGDIDCQDGSDEANCTTATPTTPPSTCRADQFDCGDNQCISREMVCDGAKDCRNWADESKDLECDNNPCSINNGGCDQICVNLFRNKHRCECRTGFAFMEGSTTVCTDIDECKDNHIHGVCSQTCHNIKGSYKCGCINDYSLVDHRYCKAIGGHPELLLADKKDLRRFHLETKKYNLLLDNSKVFGAIALDFDFEERKFYWTDVTLESIFRADLDAKSVEVVVNHTVHTPDGLAVDWINKHIYWTDTGFDRIELASLDGKMRKTLIDTDLDEPRAIVLDPNNGYVYWTDWGMHPKIERCGLNGENREIIVDKNITWPNGLTIDYAANRLYWIDAKLHTIESANLDGTQRVTVLQSHLHLKHPFAITVFEDYLYWTDWSSESVRKFSKFGRDNVSTIALDLHSPMDVHVFHPYRQTTTKRGKEFCGDDKQGCSHFCLPKPLRKIEDYNPASNHYTCACSNGFVLQADGRTCIESTENATTGISTTAKPTPVPCKPDSPNRTCNRSSQVPPVVTAVPTQETTEIKTPRVEVSTEGPGGYTVVTEHNETQPHQPQHKDEENIGHIAAIVIGVLVALVLIAAVVFFMLYRKYSRNHGKSMNFDNPVYRKTTTEELIIEKNRNANLPSTLQPLTQTTHEIV